MPITDAPHGEILNRQVVGLRQKGVRDAVSKERDERICTLSVRTSLAVLETPVFGWPVRIHSEDRRALS